MPRMVEVPKEIEDQEGRVSMQFDGVAELVHYGHVVLVESGAGEGSGFSDVEYERTGARVVEGAEEAFGASDLIVKVKESIPEEYDRYREGQELLTYLHLAADKSLPTLGGDLVSEPVAEIHQLPHTSLERDLD